MSSQEVLVSIVCMYYINNLHFIYNYLKCNKSEYHSQKNVFFFFNIRLRLFGLMCRHA